MRYVVLMDMHYYNSFRYYGDAADLRDRLQKITNKNVEIITYDEFKGR